MTRADKIKQWQDGAGGFLQWLADVKPMIPSSKGGFEVFVPDEGQEEFFRNALRCNEDSGYIYQTIIDSEPRRHSKTVKMALLVLWRFSLFQTQNVIVMANSTQQVRGVAYKLLKTIILNTPFLRKQIGVDNVLDTEIRYPPLQSTITPVSTSIGSLYGQKISVAWTTELHSSPSPESYQVLASSIGDTENSWLLLDSTVDPPGGPLHQLEQASKDDPSVYIYKIEYKNLAEALEKSPHWISRRWLKSREKQLLPATFASQHLNKRSEASNRLFDSKNLKACKSTYPIKPSLDQLQDMLSGRKYVCGSALDRAYAFSKHGDKSVWITVAKSSDDAGQAVYHVLNIKKWDVGLSKSIKRKIIEDHALYDLHNVCFEMYNSQDLHTWAVEEGISAETIQANNTQQESAFQDLAMLVSEGRIHFPADKETDNLIKQMSPFAYEITKSGRATFGTRKKKDDYVYALAWAVYSLRKSETVIYELGDIVCNSKSPHARLCLLRNGNMILNCSNSCAAYKQVQAMYNQYRKANPESELTIQDFFSRLVKVKGIRTYKAV